MGIARRWATLAIALIVVGCGSNSATYSGKPKATTSKFNSTYGSDYEGGLCGFYVRAVNRIGASFLVFAGVDSRLTWS